MEITRLIQNQTANFWQWIGVDYPLFCQTTPICEFTDTEENVGVSGYELPPIKDCEDTGVGYCYPFKRGDKFKFTVPLDAIGATPQSQVRLGIAQFGVPKFLDVATVKFVGDFVWFEGTLPNGLSNGNYQFIIYSDAPTSLSLSLIDKVNNLSDTECVGVIEVVGSGGLAPYEYSLDGTNYQSSGRFEGLCNGVYTVWMRDANCAGQVITVEIRTFPGCEFFNDKDLQYLCDNRWTVIDLCNCEFNCE